MNLNEEQWNELVDRQKKLLAGEEVVVAPVAIRSEVKEEVKVVVEERKSLFTVANVKWDYFSPENSAKVS